MGINDKGSGAPAAGSAEVARKIEEVIYHFGATASMRRDRPFDGQPHTDEGERGKTEVRGITFRDLRDCFIRAFFLAGGNNGRLYQEATKGEQAIICANDLYDWDLNELDPMAICQAMACEVERLMGIYPNIPQRDAAPAAPKEPQP